MNINRLISSWKTVFSIADLAFLLDMKHEQSLRNYLSRCGKTWVLHSLAYGLRWLEKYDTYELASKLKKKSYISLETVLSKHGVIYQDYGQTIFCVSDNTIKKKAGEYTYVYHKIADKILLNPLGINHMWNYAIASVERAICDRLYLSPWYYFDNLEQVSVEKLEEIGQMYPRTVRLAISQQISNASQRHA